MKLLSDEAANQILSFTPTIGADDSYTDRNFWRVQLVPSEGGSAPQGPLSNTKGASPSIMGTGSVGVMSGAYDAQAKRSRIAPAGLGLSPNAGVVGSVTLRHTGVTPNPA